MLNEGLNEGSHIFVGQRQGWCKPRKLQVLYKLVKPMY